MRSPIGGDLLARRYRLIDRVGAGGMSVVWRARDEVLDRLVAVKWLGSELADDELFRDLVRREAWATAQIKHPAVTAVYDYGEVSDPDGQSRAYVVMEMLDGDSLSGRLRRGPLPWREAVAIGSAVADALATAHQRGVVHRDISPDNVMLTSSGLRVFDFGIAAPIGEPDDDATGSTFGTPAYVAPERLDGQPAQTATDVYSLGVLLFEMLTGQPPFPEDTWNPDAALRARPAPRPRGVPGLPKAVARLTQRCLAHDPAARPSAKDVALRLSAYARPWRRRTLLSVAAAGVLLAGVVAYGLTSWPASAPSRPSTLDSPSSVVLSSPPTSALPSPSTSPPSPAAPTPSASSPSSNVDSSVGPGPSTTTVAVAAPIPAGQALDLLRATIDAAVPTGMADDIAQDLRNAVDNIVRKRNTDPTADVTSMVDSLRDKVLVRSMERDSNGNLRMTAATRDALLASIAQVRTSVALP